MGRMRIVIGLLALVLAAGGLSVQPAAGADPSIYTGEFVPLQTSRVVDTRSGFGLAQRPLGARSATTLRVTGRGGIPPLQRDLDPQVYAVALTVTAITPTTGGYLTFYPSGKARPAVSSLNFGRGRTVTTMVTTGVSRDGKITIYSSARTELLIDILGFYTNAYAGIDPRLGPTTTLLPFATPLLSADTQIEPQGPLRPGETMRAGFDLADTKLNAQVRAMWAVITIYKPTRSGYLTAWGGGSRPKVSTLAFVAGEPMSTSTIVSATPCLPCGGYLPPTINIRNASKGRVHVQVEIFGAFVSGKMIGAGYDLRLAPSQRISDSRRGLNAATLQPKVIQNPEIPPIKGQATTYAGATLTTLTAINPSAATPIQAWGTTIWDANPQYKGMLALKLRTVSSPMLIVHPWENGYSQGFHLQATTGRTDYTIDYVGRFIIPRTPSGAGLQPPPKITPIFDRR